MNKIVLDSIEVKKNTVIYSFHTNADLDKFFKTKTLFIEYEDDVSTLPLSILSIPFVNILAGLSWVTGSMLFVDELDKTYYDSFKQLKVAYSELHHTKLDGVLVPSRIISNHYSDPVDKAFLLFGGGVDCHSSFLRNRTVISRIVNIYGWLKDIDEKSSVDESDAKTTEEYASRMGVEAVHVRSNFAALFDLPTIDRLLSSLPAKTTYWYGFLHPMAFLSISAPLAFLNQVPQLIIASSFTKDRADVHCASFITTDSEFCFADQGHTLHDGFELNRQDKVKLLVDYQRSIKRPYRLQACSFNDHNCCVCEKCFRTMVELIAENADPREFGFDDINGSLKEHWESVVSRDVALWGVAKESYYYYYSKLRMMANYDQLTDENKAFANWFMHFDFEKAKRTGLRKYYWKNLFKIIKRKLHL